MSKLIKFIFWTALILLAGWLLWDSIISEQIALKRYPLKYSEIVEEAADEFGVPTEMVYAVIHTESSFISDVTSHAGAKGLMQIIDETNEWIALHLHEEVMPERLFEPEFNVRRGTWLLSYLYEKFGTWEVALAAYNAGIGRVSGWLADDAYSPDGKTLEFIPITETREYVERVMLAANKYRELYFEK